MRLTEIRWGLAVVATLLAEITLIALSILVVAVYSYAIHTGETQEFYSAFARASGPWVSLITGGPVFFLIARWIRRRAPAAAVGTTLTMLGIYLTLEIVALLVWPSDASGALAFTIGGFVLKAAGAWLGATAITSSLPRQLAR
jgi:hypothetical protein